MSLRVIKRAFCPWRRLWKKPRYQPGSFRHRTIGQCISYTDGASCASAGAAIFDKHLYAFATEQPRPRIIDCGANIGLAVLYWKQKFPLARITAIEPDPLVFETLQQNVSNWGCSDVELLRAAVSDRAGEATFSIRGGDAGHLVAASHSTDVAAVPQTVVSTVPLVDFLEEPVSFLKIDIEGAEVDVLANAAHKLHNVERVFVEWHSFAEQEQRLHVLLSILAESGFRIHCQPEYFVQTPCLGIVNDSGMDNRINIFAINQWA